MYLHIGHGTSVLCYVDDFWNLWRSIASLQRNFYELKARYYGIGLSIHLAKLKMLIFSYPSSM